MNVLRFGGLLWAMICLLNSAAAQVVQLPSIETFSYRGSVLVPDQGTASQGMTSLGGVSRSRLSRGSLSSSHRDAGVSATIIDLDAMDRAIRGVDDATDTPVIDPNSRNMQTERGKALVRLARRQYKAGNEGQSFQTYRVAIRMLDGRLQRLATVEFRKRFGIAARQ